MEGQVFDFHIEMGFWKEPALSGSVDFPEVRGFLLQKVLLPPFFHYGFAGPLMV